jgi:hypothetical protein
LKSKVSNVLPAGNRALARCRSVLTSDNFGSSKSCFHYVGRHVFSIDRSSSRPACCGVNDFHKRKATAKTLRHRLDTSVRPLRLKEGHSEDPQTKVLVPVPELGASPADNRSCSCARTCTGRMRPPSKTPEGRARMAEGRMKLVGAVCEIATGRVRLLA